MNLIRRSGLLFFLSGMILGTGMSGRAGDFSWPEVSFQTKPWVWWWWPGSAVDTTNIARQLKQFQQAGLGGVQVTPIYGAKGWESHDLPYLSPAWMRMMGYTAGETRELGLGMDMTLGTGWCFGGPTVSNQDANASVVVKTYPLDGGEHLDRKFDPQSTQAIVAFGPDARFIDLTGSLKTNRGEISFSPPEDWVRAGSNAAAPACVVYAISQSPSGQKVKRAAPGGAGWMLNPVYPQAMRNWLQWFNRAFARYRGPLPQAVFQDSYEYRTDWAPDFFAQFKKLRGYPLQTELPALFGNAEDDQTARVKYDYRRTVSDIMAEQSEPVWIGWAHQHRFQAIYQAHGTPGNWLDLYADADIPETEMFHNDRSILISKFASSAAHVAGHPLTGAETGTWLKEHFTVTLADLKYLADDMFLSGVNHIYYHGCCYSPEAAPWPGWVFYASTEMNPRNSIWHDVPALNAYVARCQSILQSGGPDDDVLLYWPVADLWQDPSGLLPAMTVSQTAWFTRQPVAETAQYLWEHGYAFDYLSDRQLQEAKTTRGKIRVRGGRYQVILSPPCQYMPESTLAGLLKLVRSGATVIFESRLPLDVPGWSHLQNRRDAFKELLSQVRPVAVNAHLQEATLGRGRVLIGDPASALARAGVTRESMADQAGLSFIRRTFSSGWNYFIANRGQSNFDGWITLGRGGRSAVVLDPMTGAAGVAAQNGTGRVRVQLGAGESLVLRAFAHKQVKGPAWPYWNTNGPPVEISGRWTVKFVRGGPALPANYQTEKLASWTTFPDTNTEAFAGSADYSVTFDAPDGVRGACFLDLGEVCQSARVKLNGEDYGTLITPPFRVAVNNLKPADNRLEVEITNVSANRIRDLDRRHVNWKYFYDINVVNINYRPFDASGWPLADSGLLGPVTLTPITAE